MAQLENGNVTILDGNGNPVSTVATAVRETAKPKRKPVTVVWARVPRPHVAGDRKYGVLFDATDKTAQRIAKRLMADIRDRLGARESRNTPRTWKMDIPAETMDRYTVTVDGPGRLDSGPTRHTCVQRWTVVSNG